MNGILFKPDMIKAIIEGRKTQTRRIMKLNLGFGWELPNPTVSDGVFKENLKKLGETGRYHIGQKLYIKEAWKVGAWRDDGRMAIDYLNSPEITHTPWVYPPKDVFQKLADESFEDCEKNNAKWDASFNNGKGGFVWEAGKSPCRKRSPMFLYEIFARYFIEITNVEPQRLQEITPTDVEAEGTPSNPLGLISYRNDGYQRIKDYQFLWDDINHKWHWSLNPWVWKYSFKLVK